MSKKNAWTPLALLLFTLSASLWLIVTLLFQPLASSSYPYPPYPTQGVNILSPTPTFTPPPRPPIGPQPATATPTFWPSPTSYTATPPSQPRQGVSGGHNLYSQRHRLGSWGYNWGQMTLPPPYGTPNPYDPAIPTVQHIIMAAWRPWNGPDVPVTVIVTTTPNVTQIATSTPRPTVTFSASQFNYLNNRLGHHYWLVFNECESSTQCRTKPEDAARFLGNNLIPYLKGLDPEIKLIVGGVNAHKCGIQWLEQMTKTYNQSFEPSLDQQIAGWHFHLYPEIVHSSAYGQGADASGWIPGALECDYGSEAQPNYAWVFDDERVATVDQAWQAWQTDVQNVQLFVQNFGEENDEIWITEMGCLSAGRHLLQNPFPVCQQNGYLAEYVSRITGWLNSAGRWIDRYNWFIEWDTTYWYFTYLDDMTPTPSRTPGPTPTRTPTPPPTPTATPGATPTPSPGLTPSITPSPTYQELTALGIYYSQLTPNAPVKWNELFPTKLFLPLLLP